MHFSRVSRPSPRPRSAPSPLTSSSGAVLSAADPTTSPCAPTPAKPFTWKAIFCIYRPKESKLILIRVNTHGNRRAKTQNAKGVEKQPEKPPGACFALPQGNRFPFPKGFGLRVTVQPRSRGSSARPIPPRAAGPGSALLSGWGRPAPQHPSQHTQCKARPSVSHPNIPQGQRRATRAGTNTALGAHCGLGAPRSERGLVWVSPWCFRKKCRRQEACGFCSLHKAPWGISQLLIKTKRQLGLFCKTFLWILILRCLAEHITNY